MILSLFRRPAVSAPIVALQHRITLAALAPSLYLEGGIPDSFEGRFESLTLHAGLVVRHLQALPPPGRDAAQELVDATFDALDRSIRELGVGDVSVPKKMKTLAKHVYGRFEAYEIALRSGELGALTAALARNVTDGRDAGPLADYVRQAVARLGPLGLDDVMAADPLFPEFASGVAS